MKNLKHHTTPSHELDHTYYYSFKQISMDQQYADDTAWATKNKREIKAIKQVAPSLVPFNSAVLFFLHHKLSSLCIVDLRKLHTSNFSRNIIYMTQWVDLLSRDC